MHQSPTDDQELFTKEITKMHLMGMTYREIRNETGISLDTIHLAIKQFKNDLFITYNYSNRDCKSSYELQSP
jgi:transposase